MFKGIEIVTFAIGLIAALGMIADDKAHTYRHHVAFGLSWGICLLSTIAEKIWG